MNQKEIEILFRLYQRIEQRRGKYSIPKVQEVVKVDLIQKLEPSPVIEKNISNPSPVVAAELILGNITLRLLFVA